MPNTVTCNFVVPANSDNGGQLRGNGFNGRPVLYNGDSITVQVVWNLGGTAPASLQGYFVFSPANDADTNQAAPSPFLSGGEYVCYLPVVANVSQGPGATTYTFSDPRLTYQGALIGNYELTFVVENHTGDASQATQWSADPEFDTGN